MSRPTDPLREEHKELFPHVEQLRATADGVGSQPLAEPRRSVDNAYEFLVGHLLPHAHAEEATLYPLVANVMGAPLATETMRRDHTEVGHLTEELSGLRQRLATGQLDSDLERSLQQVLYGLYTLVRVHFAKEEEVYLPVLDEKLTDADARDLFEAMESASKAARRTISGGR
jgi:iron-sulfur cluster repair protein YtfE (RIC family)